jgi:hypothetical protein
MFGEIKYYGNKNCFICQKDKKLCNFCSNINVRCDVCQGFFRGGICIPKENGSVDMCVDCCYFVEDIKEHPINKGNPMRLGKYLNTFREKIEEKEKEILLLKNELLNVYRNKNKNIFSNNKQKNKNNKNKNEQMLSITDESIYNLGNIPNNSTFIPNNQPFNF